MSYPLILLTLSLLTLLSTACFIRENRLRRALQRLLIRLITAWRNHREPNEGHRPSDPADSVRVAPTDRLHQ